MKTFVQSFYNLYSDQIRHPQYRWFIILGTVAYLISPFDISPDFIPIIGWIDDGVVITLLATELSRVLIEKRQFYKGTKVNVEESDSAIPTSVEVEAKAI